MQFTYKCPNTKGNLPLSIDTNKVESQIEMKATATAQSIVTFVCPFCGQSHTCQIPINNDPQTYQDQRSDGQSKKPTTQKKLSERLSEILKSIKEQSGKQSGKQSDDGQPIDRDPVFIEADELPPVPDSVFMQQLQSIMTDNKYTRQLANRKQGRLHSRSLWKPATGCPKIFTQKLERQNKEYHVQLLIDQSGSMNRDGKIYAAANAALFMADALTKAGVYVQISGFNCVYRPDILPETNRPLSQKELEDLNRKIIEPLNQDHGTGGNHDFTAIQAALENLNKKDYKKILLVFSDGQPSCDYCRYNPESLSNREDVFARCLNPRIEAKDPTLAAKYRNIKDDNDELIKDYMIEVEQNSDEDKIKKMISQNPQILSVGFGIQSDSVREIYPISARIDDLDQLKSAVMHILKTHIKRG